MSRLTKLLLIIISNAPYKRDRKLRTTIRLNVAREESLKIRNNQSLDCFISNMMMNEFRERGQKAVCQGLTIHTVDDRWHRKSHGIFEIILDFF